MSRSILTVALLVASLANVAVAAPSLDRLVAQLRSTHDLDATGAPLFPDDLDARKNGAVVELTGTFTDTREETDALRHEALLGALTALGVEDGLDVRVLRNDAWQPLGGVRKPVPTKPSELRPPAPRLNFRIQPTGALAGKRIAISAGHGWLQNDAGTWYTQRSQWKFDGCGNCRGVTEDFFSAEFVGDQLLPLLEGMGAQVVLVRDPDRTSEPMSIVDDASGAFTNEGSFLPGSSPGGFDSGYRVADPGTSAAANFRFPVTREGFRRVSVRWVEGANRTTATAEIRHTGGTASMSLDQTQFGRFWLDLGGFWFTPDDALLRLSQGPTGYLVADAARLGGGTFATSNKPWWQMAARWYVPWAGTDPWVLEYGDVSIRPAYAEFVGADAYVSIHANASGASSAGGTANGLSTYRFNCLEYADHSRSDAATNCDGPVGSKRLVDVAHAAMLRRLRGNWDANFGDRNTRVANFGELRTLEGIPGILVESAFFDNISNPGGSPPPKMPDNKALHDPRFRETLATGLAEGLAEYFGANGRLPARPDGLRVRNRADGKVELAFRSANDATYYRVQWIEAPTPYRARAWNDGRTIEGNSLVFDDLVPGATYAFRVSGGNALGLGFPSQAVVVKVRGAKNVTGRVSEGLVVAAYDRRDAWVQARDNDFATSIEHAQALSAVPGLYFDGALDEAVEDGSVALTDYAFVDYFAGKDSSEHNPVSRTLQNRLYEFHAAGGRLLMSGEEIGYVLAYRSPDGADLAWFEEFIGARYVADDANTYDVRGVTGGTFDGFSFRLDDGTQGTYEVVYPDVLSPGPDAPVLLLYGDGTGAATYRDRLFFAGFPIEAVVPADARGELVRRIVQRLGVTLSPTDQDLDGADDECELDAGLDPLDANDGASDLDGDGKSNAAECAAGTNPNDPRVTPDGGVIQPDAGVPSTDGGGGDGGDGGGGGEVEKPCGCAGSDVSWLAPLLLALVRRRRFGPRTSGQNTRPIDTP